MLDFDLVKFTVSNQIENLYPVSFKLKTANTIVLKTKNLFISTKIAEVSSLRDFQYNGKITLFQKNISSLKKKEIRNYRSKISIAGGNDLLFYNMSIINNIALPLRIRNVSKKVIKKRIEELVLWLNIKNIVYKEVKNLNEHEYKLIQLVRAVITNPKILILINPLSLNSSFNETILKLLNGLMSYKTTLLILENLNYNYEGFFKGLEIIKLNSDI